MSLLYFDSKIGRIREHPYCNRKVEAGAMEWVEPFFPDNVYRFANGCKLILQY